MTQDEVLAEFRDAGALLEGHFILSSGLHSPIFLQKMFIFMDPGPNRAPVPRAGGPDQGSVRPCGHGRLPGGRRHHPGL